MQFYLTLFNLNLFLSRTLYQANAEYSIHNINSIYNIKGVKMDHFSLRNKEILLNKSLQAHINYRK